MNERIPSGVEFVVQEDRPVVSQVHLVEVIHVELPDKGREPVVAIVSGEDDFLQLFLVEDANALEFGVPVDDLGVFLGLSGRRSNLRMFQSLLIIEAGLS